MNQKNTMQKLKEKYDIITTNGQKLAKMAKLGKKVEMGNIASKWKKNVKIDRECKKKGQDKIRSFQKIA